MLTNYAREIQTLNEMIASQIRRIPSHVTLISYLFFYYWMVIVRKRKDKSTITEKD